MGKFFKKVTEEPEEVVDTRSRQERAMDELEEALEEVTGDAYDRGWEAGYDAALNDEENNSEQYAEGFNDGVQAEKDRGQKLLKMYEEMALGNGKGAEAVKYRQAAELLAIVYDPIKAEENYRIEMENF